MLYQSLFSISNFIILLASIGLASVGIYGCAINAPFVQFYHSIASGVVLSLGLLLALFSLIGPWAARVKSRALARIFFFLVTLIVVALVIIGSLSLAKSVQSENIVWDHWKETKNHDPQSIRLVEQTFHCCGLSDLKDDAVPANCSEDPAFGFQEACKEKIQQRLQALLEHVGKGTLFFTLIIVVALVFGLLFAAGMEDERSMRSSAPRMAGFVREGEISPSSTLVR